MLRSFLFVPGDSAKKLTRAESASADALILDLEDAVAEPNKAPARTLVRQFLNDRPKERRTCELWVRINPLDSGLALLDLTAVLAGSPEGLVLPKANGPADVLMLSHYLDALEVHLGLPLGGIKIMVVATETARAPFQLGDYAQAGLARLWGLTWGAEDLSATLGATSNVDKAGNWASTYSLVRSLTLLAAHASGVQAIETLYVDFRDDDGLLASCRASRTEGFTGRIAIHPAQVAIINAAYVPSAEEVEHAKRVVAAFELAGGAGTVALDGKMIDIPHRKQAQRILDHSLSAVKRP
jgi:citrate lyase subunit beta/citryl-CoA lyase